MSLDESVLTSYTSYSLLTPYQSTIYIFMTTNYSCLLLSLFRIFHLIFMNLCFAFKIVNLHFGVFLITYFWEDLPCVYSTFILHLIPLGGYFSLDHLFSFILYFIFSLQFQFCYLSFYYLSPCFHFLHICVLRLFLL